MYKLQYSNHFLRMSKKLSEEYVLQFEEKVEIFRRDPKSISLRVHALTGKMKGYFSFSVNYSIRAIFQKTSKDTVLFTSIGPHNAVYRE